MPPTAAFVTRAFAPVARRRSRPALICANYKSDSNSTSRARRYHPLEPLKSVTNSRVKFVRSLLRRKHRDETGKVLLEGHRLVLDAVKAGIELEEMYYTVTASSRSTSLIPAFDACVEHPVPVDDKVMVSMSDTVTPQGVVAIISRPERTLPKKSTLLLICDAVQDPGNVGTLIRAAAGAGVDGVLLTEGSADPWSPKALRSGMGAQMRIPVHSGITWDNVQSVCQRFQLDICVADGNAEFDYTQVDWNKPSALVIGSEANGPTEKARKAATTTVSIPMENDVESQNAAVAGAVLMFEAQRQRNKVPKKTRAKFGEALRALNRTGKS